MTHLVQLPAALHRASFLRGACEPDVKRRRSCDHAAPHLAAPPDAAGTPAAPASASLASSATATVARPSLAVSQTAVDCPCPPGLVPGALADQAGGAPEPHPEGPSDGSDADATLCPASLRPDKVAPDAGQPAQGVPEGSSGGSGEAVESPRFPLQLQSLAHQVDPGLRRPCKIGAGSTAFKAYVNPSTLQHHPSEASSTQGPPGVPLISHSSSPTHFSSLTTKPQQAGEGAGAIQLRQRSSTSSTLEDIAALATAANTNTASEDATANKGSGILDPGVPENSGSSNSDEGNGSAQPSQAAVEASQEPGHTPADGGSFQRWGFRGGPAPAPSPAAPAAFGLPYGSMGMRPFWETSGAQATANEQAEMAAFCAAYRQTAAAVAHEDGACQPSQEMQEVQRQHMLLALHNHALYQQHMMMQHFLLAGAYPGPQPQGWYAPQGWGAGPPGACSQGPAAAPPALAAQQGQVQSAGTSTPSGSLEAWPGGSCAAGQWVQAAGGAQLAEAAPGSAGQPITQQDRRTLALHKYKLKRKNLCFTKKIRYESRKQLAKARPRVKGQFVRRDSSALDAEELEEGVQQLPEAEQQAAAAVLQLAHQILHEDTDDEELGNEGEGSASGAALCCPAPT